MTEGELITIVQTAIDALPTPLDGHDAWAAVCTGLRAAGEGAPSGLSFQLTNTNEVSLLFLGFNITVVHV